MVPASLEEILYCISFVVSHCSVALYDVCSKFSARWRKCYKFLHHPYLMFVFQEDQNRGKPNWEHLNDELHVLITVEDSENRANVKLQRAVEEVKKLLVVVRICQQERAVCRGGGRITCTSPSPICSVYTVRGRGRAQEAPVNGTCHNQRYLQRFSVKKLIT